LRCDTWIKQPIILFDMPAVVERARANIEVAGLTDRCRVVVGNFFEAVPPGADAYLMRHIIHDWDDEKSITVLANCRKAMGDQGRLMVVDARPPRPSSSPTA
jgi:O-methyltransferase domain